jgi:hypothetical protein
LLRALGDVSPWREHVDEYNAGAGGFHERHYNEFVTFLPYVQRFLYGEGRTERGGGDAASGSPMRVFRRRDMAAVRVVPRPGDNPVTLQVVHVDLYFFYGVDIVPLNVEWRPTICFLPLAQELIYRFGQPTRRVGTPRVTPCTAWPASSGWMPTARCCRAAMPSSARPSWPTSPSTARHASRRGLRAGAGQPSLGQRRGAARFRQIEYYRMPMMAYPRGRQTPAADTRRFHPPRAGHRRQRNGRRQRGRAAVRVAIWPTLRDGSATTASGPSRGPRRNTRYLCSGLALIAVGDAQSEFYRCGDRGVLAQFRHQHFMLFLIAHFQKATLLMVSDQLAEALTALDVSRPESIKRFKRQIRMSYVSFLGFTHRYWFHEVSEQAHVKALFHLCTRHLQIDSVYEEVKERIRDMNSYLDADALRRQANTVVRLTVVTTFGLIGTVTTGFLGMNLLAAADAPLTQRAVVFLIVLVLTVALTMFTIGKSKRLSDFLDVVSDERLSGWIKLKSFLAVWRPSHRESDGRDEGR